MSPDVWTFALPVGAVLVCTLLAVLYLWDHW